MLLGGELRLDDFIFTSVNQPDSSNSSFAGYCSVTLTVDWSWRENFINVIFLDGEGTGR